MKVLLTRKIPDSALHALEENGLEVDYRQGKPLSTSELLDAVKDVDAIIPVIPDQITKEIIEAGKNLKVIATYSVGYDHIDIDVATKNKIYVANTPGDLTSKSVAEFALAMILALGTKLVDADEFCRLDKYDCWDPMIFLGTRTVGKTLGIVGFGRIGQTLAEMVKGLEMKIVYYDIKKLESSLEKKLNATYLPLEELLGVSDYISLHTNLTAENKHLINDKEFSLMKPESILINTSRGAIVSEDALIRALKEGTIQGAGLDVFEYEPKIHSDLAGMKNVILSPHIASGTREVRIQMANMAAKNVIDVLIDKTPPTYLVNRELAETVSGLS